MPPTADRYAVTLTGGSGGPHTPPTVLTVHRTELHGPGGFPVYADASGLFRVQIAGDIARPLTGTDSFGHKLLHAVPLP
ncbi:DUF6296 family protein [Streptodolium elevatio]